MNDRFQIHRWVYGMFALLTCLVMLLGSVIALFNAKPIHPDVRILVVEPTELVEQVRKELK